MDIAVSIPVKTPQRTDATRAPLAQDDPYQDDFATELENAAPAESGVAEPPKGVAGKPNPASKPVTSQSQNTDADLTATAPTPDANTAVAAPVAPKAVAQIQPDPAPATGTASTGAQFSNVTAKPSTADSNQILAAAAMPLEQTTGKPVDPNEAGESEASKTPAPPSQSQFIVPPSDIGVAARAMAAGKKTQASKSDAATAQHSAAAPGSAPTQGTPTQGTPAQGTTAQGTTAASAQNAQSGAQNEGSDKPPANGVHASGPALAQSQTPSTQEFKLDASAAQPAPQPASQPAQNAAPAAPALVAQNAPVFVPPEALGVAIARKALEGINKFELRLDPPELGRLDVSLEVDEAGNTRAHIRAERPEALELLQREAKGMEQALRQAGLNLDQSSLSFSLSGRDGREAHEQPQHGRRAKFNAVLPEDEIHAAVIRGSAASTSGVDLRV